MPWQPEIGEKVRAVKWRDGGETAELLCVGVIVAVTDDEVQVRVIETPRNGWVPGSIIRVRPDAVLPVR